MGRLGGNWAYGLGGCCQVMKWVTVHSPSRFTFVNRRRHHLIITGSQIGDSSQFASWPHPNLTFLIGTALLGLADCVFEGNGNICIRRCDFFYCAPHWLKDSRNLWSSYYVRLKKYESMWTTRRPPWCGRRAASTKSVFPFLSPKIHYIWGNTYLFMIAPILVWSFFYVQTIFFFPRPL